jgi:hypothetical protein
MLSVARSAALIGCASVLERRLTGMRETWRAWSRLGRRPKATQRDANSHGPVVEVWGMAGQSVKVLAALEMHACNSLKLRRRGRMRGPMLRGPRTMALLPDRGAS